MRVMVFVKASKESEAGQMPTEQMLREMGNFNEQLVKAGIMEAGEGLKPSSAGKRVKFSGAERVVTDGPFAETTEQLGGFYLVDAPDLDTMVDLCDLLPHAYALEVRPVADLSSADDWLDAAQA